MEERRSDMLRGGGGVSGCTCCNQSDVMRAFYSYSLFASSGNVECRNLSLAVLCSSCHPDVSTGLIGGVCSVSNADY